MQLDIDRNDVDAFRFVCALHDYTCHFAPTQKRGMISVRITDKGREIPAGIALCLGREVEKKLDLDASNSRLQELDLMQHPKNNVLVTVESIDDLPR